MPDFPFPGLNLAVTTPFAADGRVDFDRLEEHLERYIAAGVDGFVLSSGTGMHVYLSREESDTLLAWVEQGCAKGDEADLPPPLKFVEGWNIDQPDKIVTMADEFKVPATGVLDYQRFIVDPGFVNDMWVQAAECRPGNRAVVHHILVYIGVFDDGYYAELELPPAPSDDSLYEVARRLSGLGFAQLVDVIAKHLSLGSKIMVDNPMNKDDS